MAKTGKTIATLLVGAAVGAAIGYILATDKEKRQEDFTKIKDKFKDLKDRMAKKTEDLEHDIYHS
jgi:gas vesicle protein